MKRFWRLAALSAIAASFFVAAFASSAQAVYTDHFYDDSNCPNAGAGSGCLYAHDHYNNNNHNGLVLVLQPVDVGTGYKNFGTCCTDDFKALAESGVNNNSHWFKIAGQTDGNQPWACLGKAAWKDPDFSNDNWGGPGTWVTQSYNNAAKAAKFGSGNDCDPTQRGPDDE